MCIVESLLELHAFIVMLSLYDECKWRFTFTLLWWWTYWRCTLHWCELIRVKLSMESSWYKMHVEMSRKLHVLENWWDVSYLTMWIDDHVDWWMLRLCENMNCICRFIMLVCLQNNVDVEVHCWMNYLSVYLLIIRNEYVALLSFDYILFVEYNLTLNSCLVDRLPICMNG